MLKVKKVNQFYNSDLLFQDDKFFFQTYSLNDNNK